MSQLSSHFLVANCLISSSAFVSIINFTEIWCHFLHTAKKAKRFGTQGIDKGKLVTITP
jgi:hypothetical protein